MTVLSSTRWSFNSCTNIHLYKTHSTAVPSSTLPACPGGFPLPQGSVGPSQEVGGLIWTKEGNSNHISFEACSHVQQWKCNCTNFFQYKDGKSLYYFFPSPPHPQSSSSTGRAWSESRILHSINCWVNVNAHSLPSTKVVTNAHCPGNYLHVEGCCHLHCSPHTLTHACSCH